MKRTILVIIVVIFSLALFANTTRTLNDNSSNRRTATRQWASSYSSYNATVGDRTIVTEAIDTGDNSDTCQIRRTLTWEEIKKLLKRKSGNIWKLRRNNIPTANH